HDDCFPRLRHPVEEFQHPERLFLIEAECRLIKHDDFRYASCSSRYAQTPFLSCRYFKRVKMRNTGKPETLQYLPGLPHCLCFINVHFQIDENFINNCIGAEVLIWDLEDRINAPGNMFRLPGFLSPVMNIGR